MNKGVLDMMTSTDGFAKASSDNAWTIKEAGDAIAKATKKIQRSMLSVS